MAEAGLRIRALSSGRLGLIGIGLPARAGFTLVEVILVVILLGVLLSVAAPSFKGYENSLPTAARQSASFFRQTRSLAMARTAAYRVVVVSPTELRVDFASTCNSAAWQTDPRVRLDLTEKITMEGADIVAGTTLVCYSSRGIGNNSPSFLLRDRRKNAHRVDVFTGGAVVTTPAPGA